MLFSKVKRWGSVENGSGMYVGQKLSIFNELSQALALGRDADTPLCLFFHSLSLFLNRRNNCLSLYIFFLVFFPLFRILPLYVTPRDHIFYILFERDKIADLPQGRPFRDKAQLPTFLTTIFMRIARRVMIIGILGDPCALRVDVKMCSLQRNGLVALR